MMVIGESPYLSVVECLSKTLALLMFLKDEYGLFSGTLVLLPMMPQTHAVKDLLMIVFWCVSTVCNFFMPLLSAFLMRMLKLHSNSHGSLARTE